MQCITELFRYFRVVHSLSTLSRISRSCADSQSPSHSGAQSHLCTWSLNHVHLAHFFSLILSSFSLTLWEDLST